MYDWSGETGFSPVGEIYAANQTVSSWSDVICLNLTGNGTVGQTGINVTIVEAMYGMAPTDADGVSETFDETGSIVIGTNTLTDNSNKSSFVIYLEPGNPFNVLFFSL